MTNSHAASTPDRRPRLTGLTVLLAAAAAVAGLASWTVDLRDGDSGIALASGPVSVGARPAAAPDRVEDGPPVLDEDSPSVANLAPELLDALRQAATEAAGDGVELTVNSGWRSPNHQAQLLREAVSQYGSEEEAARWVATPETSPHVSGDAVDIGGANAASWLARHGDDHGLCQTYRNEPWHFELRPEAIDHGCPRMFADPTKDPRMQ